MSIDKMKVKLREEISDYVSQLIQNGDVLYIGELERIHEEVSMRALVKDLTTRLNNRYQRIIQEEVPTRSFSGLVRDELTSIIAERGYTIGSGDLGLGLYATYFTRSAVRITKGP